MQQLRTTIVIASLAAALASCSSKKEETVHYRYLSLKGGGKVQIAMRDTFTDGRAIVFSPKGNIAQIDHWDKNVQVGRSYMFYENGLPKQITDYSGGRMNGKSFSFFESGRLKYVRPFTHDKLNGDCLDFFDAPSSQLGQRVNYKLVNSKEWPNGYLVYDQKGRLIKCQECMLFNYNKKQYSIDDSVVLSIKLLCPREIKIKATIDDYDSVFSNLNKLKGQEIRGQNHLVVIKTKPHSVGMNTIRGYVSDYKIIETNADGSVKTKERLLYFDSKYLVK